MLQNYLLKLKIVVATALIEWGMEMWRLRFRERLQLGWDVCQNNSSCTSVPSLDGNYLLLPEATLVDFLVTQFLGKVRSGRTYQVIAHLCAQLPEKWPALSKQPKKYIGSSILGLLAILTVYRPPVCPHLSPHPCLLLFIKDHFPQWIRQGKGRQATVKSTGSPQTIISQA